MVDNPIRWDLVTEIGRKLCPLMDNAWWKKTLAVRSCEKEDGYPKRCVLTILTFPDLICQAILVGANDFNPLPIRVNPNFITIPGLGGAGLEIL